MKNIYIRIAIVIGTIFSTNVFASDSLSVTTNLPLMVLDTTLTADISGNVLKDQTDSLRHKQVNNSNKYLIQRKKNSSVPLHADTLEFNPLLDFIEKYDVTIKMVQPMPARVQLPDENRPFPDMSPLFMPLIFNSVEKDFNAEPDPEQMSEYFHSSLLDSLQRSQQSNNYIAKLTKDILLNSETKYIGIIKYDQNTLPRPEKMIYMLKSRQPASWLKPNQTLTGGNADGRILPKTAYNPWTTKMVTKLQFSQTYNSPNWSKGGESNMAGLWTLYLEANYTNLKNIQFDNNMEVKIGMNTITSDSLRNLNISTDQVRAFSKLGIRMHKDFYYSIASEFNTQTLNNYKSNTMDLKSSFMSPAKMFVGLGVDYKKNNSKKGYNLSVLLTPLTCKMSYLYDNVNLPVKDYGIKEGEHFVGELGSKISATLTWRISENAQWKSYFYYYTDFTYIDTDWENTLDVNYNNLFTTSFYIHLKMDDRLKREPGAALIQMQELISFGLAYRF